MIIVCIDYLLLIIVCLDICPYLIYIELFSWYLNLAILGSAAMPRLPCDSAALRQCHMWPAVVLYFEF